MRPFVDDFGTDEEIDTLIDQVAELWSEISQERRKSPPSDSIASCTPAQLVPHDGEASAPTGPYPDEEEEEATVAKT
jgi:hypothetical protein